jgi:predicted glycoside hydrolase/deacetylase ChbG (UPF0249 family)
MTTRLVITADDLGIDPRRDDGILEAFEQGAITQGSLMVGGPSAKSAAEGARRVGLPLGLHLDLTEMPASAPRDTIESLLDRDGNKLGKHGLRAALARGDVDLVHVVRETEAQLAAFAALVGAPATHADGHQHIHTVPELAAAIAPVLARAGVETTRIPEQREVHVADPEAARFYRSVAEDGARARAVYTQHGVRSTTAFVGLDLMGSASDADRLREAVRALEGLASVELMCHPGFVGTLGDEFNRSPDREHELNVLLSHPFAALIEDGLVRLASFAEIAREG